MLTFLHRAADGPGRAGWVTAILSGVSENEVAIDFLTSPEYTAAHADANSFVAGLYTGIFQRAGDAAGQAYWTSVVQSGLRSRAAVAYYFLTSTEAYLQAINSYYETFLGRAPSSEETQNFVPILIHGATPGSIVALFLTSSEFINREIALACQGTGTTPG